MAVVLYFWRIPSKSIPSALWKIAMDRRSIKRIEGVTFSKLLGCGRGSTFTPTDADVHRWGLIACVSDEHLQSLESTLAIKRWQKLSVSEFRVILDPLSVHGLWSKRQPFILQQEVNSSNQLIVAITRARVAIPRYLLFLRAVPAVVEHLHSAPGLIKAFGIGEAPIGLQGTFSLWRDEASLQNFAFKDSAHREAITASQNGKWFTEELFARFAVREMRGSL
jgi:hypothetical protein